MRHSEMEKNSLHTEQLIVSSQAVVINESTKFEQFRRRARFTISDINNVP